MFFSVIVPVYKVEKYLHACIQSVLEQTFEDYELILVDDGSPDNCPAICDEYSARDSRIKVIHKPNGGLVSARIAGAKIARGDYIFNLDSDDKIEKDTLMCAYNIIKKQPCDIVIFSYKWVDEDGNCVGSITDIPEEGYYDRTGIEKAIFPNIIMDENMGHISYYIHGKAVKRELLVPVQLNVDPKISLGEDLCCTVPCYLKAQHIYISKKEACIYTRRNTSLSNSFNAGQLLQVENIINKIKEFEDIRKIIPDIDNQICRYSAFMCFAILAGAAEGNYFGSIKEIKKNIVDTNHISLIKKAEFKHITAKSKISIFLMKRKCIGTAFYFLNFCKNIKKILKRR